MSWILAPDTSALVHQVLMEKLTSSGKRRRSDETSKETEDRKAGKVGDQRGGNLEDGEEEEADDVGQGTSDVRNLSDGREEERTDGVTDHEEGQAEGDGDLSETKVLHGVLDTGCPDGTAHVDGGGHEHDHGGDTALLGELPGKSAFIPE